MGEGWLSSTGRDGDLLKRDQVIRGVKVGFCVNCLGAL